MTDNESVVEAFEYRGWQVEITPIKSRFGEPGFDWSVTNHLGKKYNLGGGGWDTISDAIECAKSDIDFIIVENATSEALKPVIEKLLKEGYKPCEIALGFGRLAYQFGGEEWKSIEMALNVPVMEVYRVLD